MNRTLEPLRQQRLDNALIIPGLPAPINPVSQGNRIKRA